MAKVGRKRDEVRDAWIERFDLKTSTPRRRLPSRLLSQLSECKDDETRRILLGISEQSDALIDEA